MKNQTKKTKKQSNQPAYEDKPWQTPQYGEKSDNAQDDSEEGCGCGSNDEKGKKNNGSLTAATDI